MKKHINKLYSMYPEQLTKLDELAIHHVISRSALLRKLIDEAYATTELPEKGANRDSGARGDNTGGVTPPTPSASEG